MGAILSNEFLMGWKVMGRKTKKAAVGWTNVYTVTRKTKSQILKSAGNGYTKADVIEMTCVRCKNQFACIKTSICEREQRCQICVRSVAPKTVEDKWLDSMGL